MKKRLNGEFIGTFRTCCHPQRLARKAPNLIEKSGRNPGYSSKDQEKGNSGDNEGDTRPSAGKRFKENSSTKRNHSFTNAEFSARLNIEWSEIVPGARVVTVHFKIPARSLIISISRVFGGFVGGMNKLNCFFGITFHRKCFRGGKEHLGLYQLTVYTLFCVRLEEFEDMGGF